MCQRKFRENWKESDEEIAKLAHAELYDEKNVETTL